MSVFKLIGGSTSAKNTLDYCDKKAVMKEGVHCFADTAEKDFERVRTAYGKEKGRQALHFTFSFAPDELDPKNPSHQRKALKMGVKMAQAISKHNQFVCYVHDDQGHLHVHIVMNAVSMADGSKFQMDVSKYRYQQGKEADYNHPNLFVLREKADEIAREYGLTPMSNEKIMQKTPYTRQNPQNSWKGRMEREVKSALQTTTSWDDFLDTLQENYIGVVVRGQTTTFEDLTRKTLQKKKYKVRSTTLVDGLTTDKIFDHLRDNSKAELELLRSRKGNTQKQNKNATEVKFEPENRPSTPLPSIQRVLNDDVEKWRAEKDYERLRQKIAHEQAQREL